MSFRKRRTYTKRSRRLTSAHIMGNRGSKSQAYQIAKINRRLNIISKENRPEVLIKFHNDTHTFTNSSLSSNYHVWSLNPWSTTYTGDDYVEGPTSTNLAGNFCRCKGVSLKLVAQYSDNWRDSIANEKHDPSAGYRIVILQYKRATPLNVADGINVNAVFNTTSTVSSDDTNLTMPLVEGISGTFKILYSKVCTINRYQPTRIHNIYIPGRKCLNFSKEVYPSGSVSTFPKGHVVCAILTGGLHNDLDYTAQLNIAGTLKVAFTDN